MYTFDMDDFINNIDTFSIHQIEGIQSLSCNYTVELYRDDLYKELEIQEPSFIQTASAKRKSEYLAGRYLSKLLLQSYNICDVSVTSGIRKEPIWPDGYTGSISHTNKRAICAISSKNDYYSLGIDCERLITSKTIESIQALVIDDNEGALLRNRDENSQEAFTIIFSAKESLFKATHCLINSYINFDSAKIVSLNMDNKKGSFILRLNNPIFDIHFRSPLIPGYYWRINDHIITLITISKKLLK